MTVLQIACSLETITIAATVGQAVEVADMNIGLRSYTRLTWTRRVDGRWKAEQQRTDWAGFAADWLSRA